MMGKQIIAAWVAGGLLLLMSGALGPTYYSLRTHSTPIEPPIVEDPPKPNNTEATQIDVASAEASLLKVLEKALTTIQKADGALTTAVARYLKSARPDYPSTAFDELLKAIGKQDADFPKRVPMETLSKEWASAPGDLGKIATVSNPKTDRTKLNSFEKYPILRDAVSAANEEIDKKESDVTAALKNLSNRADRLSKLILAAETNNTQPTLIDVASAKASLLQNLEKTLATIQDANGSLKTTVVRFLKTARPDYPSTAFDELLKAIGMQDAEFTKRVPLETLSKEWASASGDLKQIAMVSHPKADRTKLNSFDKYPALRGAVSAANEEIDRKEAEIAGAAKNLSDRAEHLSKLIYVISPKDDPIIANGIKKAEQSVDEACKLQGDAFDEIAKLSAELEHGGKKLGMMAKSLKMMTGKFDSVLTPDVPIKELKLEQEKVDSLRRKLTEGKAKLLDETTKIETNLDVALQKAIELLKSETAKASYPNPVRVMKAIDNLQAKANSTKEKNKNVRNNLDSTAAAYTKEANEAIDAASALIPDFGKIVLIVIVTDASVKHADDLEKQLEAFRVSAADEVGRDSIQMCMPCKDGNDWEEPLAHVWKPGALKAASKPFRDTEAIEAFFGGFAQMKNAAKKLSVKPEGKDAVPFKTLIVWVSNSPPTEGEVLKPPHPERREWSAFQNRLGLIYIDPKANAIPSKEILSGWFEADNRKRVFPTTLSQLAKTMQDVSLSDASTKDKKK